MKPGRAAISAPHCLRDLGRLRFRPGDDRLFHKLKLELPHEPAQLRYGQPGIGLGCVVDDAELRHLPEALHRPELIGHRNEMRNAGEIAPGCGERRRQACPDRIGDDVEYDGDVGHVDGRIDLAGRADNLERDRCPERVDQIDTLAPCFLDKFVRLAALAGHIAHEKFDRQSAAEMIHESGLGRGRTPKQDHHHLVALFLRERAAAEQKRAQYDARQKATHGDP